MVDTIVTALTTEVTGAIADIAPVAALILGVTVGYRLLKRFVK